MRWWGEHDETEVRSDIDRQPTWVIEVDGRVAGWLQANEVDSEHFPSVGFDIALAAFARGRGLGRAALRLAVEHFVGRGHHRFTIDPRVDNERAIRSYEAVGFRRVGVMRAYERLPDGRTFDGLLMDLLAEDLPPAQRG